MWLLHVVWQHLIEPGEMERALNTGRRVRARRLQNHRSSLGVWDKSWSSSVMKIPSDCWFFCFTSLCMQQPLPGYPTLQKACSSRNSTGFNKKCAQHDLYKSKSSLTLQARKPQCRPWTCQELCVSFLSELPRFVSCEPLPQQTDVSHWVPSLAPLRWSVLALQQAFLEHMGCEWALQKLRPWPLGALENKERVLVASPYPWAQALHTHDIPCRECHKLGFVSLPYLRRKEQRLQAPSSPFHCSCCPLQVCKESKQEQRAVRGWE